MEFRETQSCTILKRKVERNHSYSVPCLYSFPDPMSVNPLGDDRIPAT